MDKLVFYPASVVFLLGLVFLTLSWNSGDSAEIILNAEASNTERALYTAGDTLVSGTMVDLLLDSTTEARDRDKLFWLIEGPRDTVGFPANRPALRLTQLGTYRILAFEDMREVSRAEIRVVEGRKMETHIEKSIYKQGETISARDQSTFPVVTRQWVLMDASEEVIAEMVDADKFTWKADKPGVYSLVLIYSDEAGKEQHRHTTKIDVEAPEKPVRTPAVATQRPVTPSGGQRKTVLSAARTELIFNYNSNDPGNEAAYGNKQSYKASLTAKADFQFNHFITYLKSGKYQLTVSKNGAEVFKEELNCSSDRAWEFAMSQLGRVNKNDILEIELKLTGNKGRIFTRAPRPENLDSRYFDVSFDAGQQWMFNLDINVGS